jgi:hypothetical protein
VIENGVALRAQHGEAVDQLSSRVGEREDSRASRMSMLGEVGARMEVAYRAQNPADSAGFALALAALKPEA